MITGAGIAGALFLNKECQIKAVSMTISIHEWWCVVNYSRKFSLPITSSISTRSELCSYWALLRVAAESWASIPLKAKVRLIGQHFPLVCFLVILSSAPSYSTVVAS